MQLRFLRKFTLELQEVQEMLICEFYMSQEVPRAGHAVGARSGWVPAGSILQAGDCG